MQADLTAISNCHPDQDIYLDLPNLNSPLVSRKKTFIEKILMMLGISNASKNTVINYITTNFQQRHIEQLKDSKSCRVLIHLLRSSQDTKAALICEAVRKQRRHLKETEANKEISNRFNALDKPTDFHSGISNTGASCYMNAILQAIIRIPHFLEILQDNHTSFTAGIKKTLCLMGNRNQPASTQDAEDLLFHFCNHGWRALLGPCQDPRVKMASGIKFYEDFLAETLNLNTSWFLQDDNGSKKMSDVAINIGLKDIANGSSIEDIVQNFPTQRGKKKISIDRENPPEMIPFFLVGKNELTTEKRVTPSLTLSLPTQEENEHITYNLASVVVHKGHQLDSGHFLTFCVQENPHKNKIWVRYDDDKVKRFDLDNKEVMRQIRSEAIILFYKKALVHNKS